MSDSFTIGELDNNIAVDANVDTMELVTKVSVPLNAVGETSQIDLNEEKESKDKIAINTELSEDEIYEVVKTFVGDYSTMTAKYYMYFWVEDLPVIVMRQRYESYGYAQERAECFYIDRKTGEVHQLSVLPSINWQLGQEFYVGDDNLVVAIEDYTGNYYYYDINVEEGKILSTHIGADEGSAVVEDEIFTKQEWKFGLFASTKDENM